MASAAHVDNDPIIDDKDHDRAQREINAHTSMWLRFTRAGEFAGRNDKSEYQRIKNSCKVNHHGYAPLYTLRKDHKPVEDEALGPPTRPVCGGSAAYNHKMSHLLGFFLRPVWQGKDTVCTSTEEMIAAIEQANSSGKVDHTCTLGSLDVKSLYPSLDVEFVSEKVGEMFLSSVVNVPELDCKELGLYLALNRTPEELREKGLDKVCPTRKRKDGKPPVGRPPVMTGCAMEEQREKRFAPWEDARIEEPDTYTKKRMLAEAITIGVEHVMSNHIYVFNGEIRMQSKGGPIGLALTGDVAQVFMAWWDEEIIRRLEEKGLCVVLYKRYVDDINIITKPAAIDRTPVVGEKDDVKIMEEIQQVAGEIHASIEVTVDCQPMNNDLKVRILDMKVWLEEMKEGGEKGQVIILYEYFYKEMASKAVIDARSAMPLKTKRTILTQEVIRILRNCSRRLPWTVVSGHVTDFSARMQYSGHTHEMRSQVVKSALHAYDVMLRKDREGIEPLYRPREWKKEERIRDKRKKKREWFRGKDKSKEAVIFLPATPGSELKKSDF